MFIHVTSGGLGGPPKLKKFFCWKTKKNFFFNQLSLNIYSKIIIHVTSGGLRGPPKLKKYFTEIFIFFFYFLSGSILRGTVKNQCLLGQSATRAVDFFKSQEIKIKKCRTSFSLTGSSDQAWRSRSRRPVRQCLVLIEMRRRSCRFPSSSPRSRERPFFFQALR